MPRNIAVEPIVLHLPNHQIVIIMLLITMALGELYLVQNQCVLSLTLAGCCRLPFHSVEHVVLELLIRLLHQVWCAVFNLHDV